MLLTGGHSGARLWLVRCVLRRLKSTVVLVNLLIYLKALLAYELGEDTT